MPGSMRVGLDEVDASRPRRPRGTRLEVFGGEVQGHVGREGPVEQAGGQAVVLGERQPVPDRVAVNGSRVGVLAEVAQQMVFLPGVVAPEAHEAGCERVAGRGAASVGHVRAESRQFRVPRPLIDAFVQFVPVLDPDLFYHDGFSRVEIPGSLPAG